MFHIRNVARTVLVQILIPVVVATLGMVATSLAALAQERVALVIGNSKYQNARPLPNASNDGIDMMGTLSGLGFDVLGGTDLGYDEMNRLIGQFAEQADNAEIALVFFAGHGVQADGRNYLIPVDVRLASDRDLAFQAIDMAMLMIAVERSAFGVILLDACRDNPFIARMAQANPVRNLGSGLARADIPPRSNLLIGYATHPGGLADDGDRTVGNSPYTKALLTYLPEDMDLYRVLAHVADAVSKETQGRQNPWLEGNPPLAEIRLAANATTVRTLVPEPVSKIGGEVYTFDPEPQPCSNCGSVIIGPDEEAPDPTPQHPANVVAPPPNPSRATRCDELAANPFDPDKIEAVQGFKMELINWELAIPACEQAAAQFPQEPRFQYQLGRALQTAGRYTEARTAYLEAAKYDYGHAVNNIGTLHHSGLGVAQDFRESARWYLHAAQLGSVVGMENLVGAYLRQEGVQSNWDQSYYWAHQAALAGSSYGMHQVGMAYRFGHGVPKDFNEAIRWFTRAAELGRTESMISIGSIHSDWEDYGAAEQWYKKAIALGDVEARKSLNYMEHKQACNIRYFSEDDRIDCRLRF